MGALVRRQDYWALNERFEALEGKTDWPSPEEKLAAYSELLGETLSELGETSVDLRVTETRLKGLEDDLSRVRGVQYDLYSVPTDLGGLEAVGYHSPAAHVTGDFYGVLDLGRKRYGIYIGDVSGHGPWAAYIAGIIVNRLEYLANSEAPPGTVMNRINNRVVLPIGEYGFVTMFYGVADLERNTLTYVEAGHKTHILPSEGELHPLGGEGSFSLGFVDDFNYNEAQEEVGIKSGDILVGFTDGLWEWGIKVEELAEILNDRRLYPDKLDGAIGNMIEAIKAEMDRRVGQTGNEDFTDDVAILLTRFL